MALVTPGNAEPDDAGRYFRYMADFIGFTAADAEAIRRTRPILEQVLPEIVGDFYTHLLRHPPTRRFFLKQDGTVDREYVELRMRHQTNFWLRTADGIFDDDYARFVAYVGRAHTHRGADPTIYIAERHVIAAVGFVQHAISQALIDRLPAEDRSAAAAQEAWDKLLMVILELLARAYEPEHVAEQLEPPVAVDEAAVAQWAQRAFDLEHSSQAPAPQKTVRVAHAADLPEGERRIVQVDGLSIGVFHHNGRWYAVRNSCLHRGGPVATGTIEGNTLTCPWHGYQYDLSTGEWLIDPMANLDTYPVSIQDGEVYLQVPDRSATPAEMVAERTVDPDGAAPGLQENEFRAAGLLPGQMVPLCIGGQGVLVFNVEGVYYATGSECPHAAGPLEEGCLEGNVVVCPVHESRFDVTTGQVVEGPADEAIASYGVEIEGRLGRVTLP